MKCKHVRSQRVFRKPAEPELFAPSVDELVPVDHLVRHLKSIVEEVAGPLLRSEYGDQGGVAYDPVGVLSVELYGLMLGIRSSRQLEEACRYDARFWFLTGRLHPDHNTLARFRHRHSESLPQVFAGVLNLARARGLVGARVVAVDGTKVEGNVSQWRRIIDEAGETDEDEPSDPDSRTMPSRRGRFINGYNAQIAVDPDSGFIVGQEVVNKTVDYEQLPKVLGHVRRNLGSDPDSVVADSGYDASANHQVLDEQGITGFIVPQTSRDSFWTVDASTGQITCPEGHTPTPAGSFYNGSRLYDSFLVRACPNCPRRCTDSKYKKLTVPHGLDPRARLANAQRVASPEGQRLVRLRAQSVELAFAQLKGNAGFRRFRTRGLPAVNDEFTLECLAHNLRKLLRELLRQFWALTETLGRGRRAGSVTPARLHRTGRHTPRRADSSPRHGLR
jgi:transposase